ncbi:MAG: DUF4350 domain-containing protein [Vulcanimicrobiaceae bacterium]
MPRKRIFDMALVAIGLALIALLAVAQERRTPATERSNYSTYDFGRNGYAALYELLRREAVPAGQFERPLSLLDPDVRTLVISGPASGEISAGDFTRGDADALVAWAKRGGRLIVFGSPVTSDPRLAYPATSALRKPVRVARSVSRAMELRRVQRVSGTFQEAFDPRAKRRGVPELLADGKIVALAYRLGRGEVVAIPDATIVSNAQLAHTDNARFAYALLGIGPVAFDERVHGYAEHRRFWDALPAAVQVAVLMAIGLVVLALVGANIPFAPALAPLRASERDSSEYIESMARLLMRGRAARRAIADCAEAVLRALRLRTGLGPKAPAADVAARLDRAGWRETLLELDRLRGLERPAETDLVRAGRLSAQLRKDIE